MPYEDKVWANRAADLRLTELTRVQSTAKAWRTGLAGLTALLTAVTIIDGPERITDLTPTGRVAVTALVTVALLALLIGSGAAMRASFGMPPSEQLTSSGTLKQWSAAEATRAAWWLRVAIVSFFLAIPLVFFASVTTWFDDEWFDDEPAVSFVLVELSDGVDPEPVCGPLIRLTADEIEVGRSQRRSD